MNKSELIKALETRRDNLLTGKNEVTAAMQEGLEISLDYAIALVRQLDEPKEVDVEEVLGVISQELLQCIAGHIHESRTPLRKKLCTIIRPYLRTQPIAVSQQSGGWQPIETAPKDGIEILVAYARCGFVKKLVYFDRIHNYWKSKGEPEMGLESNATHWMPLPAPPAALQQSGGGE